MRHNRGFRPKKGNMKSFKRGVKTQSKGKKIRKRPYYKNSRGGIRL